MGQASGTHNNILLGEVSTAQARHLLVPTGKGPIAIYKQRQWDANLALYLATLFILVCLFSSHSSSPRALTHLFPTQALFTWCRGLFVVNFTEIFCKNIIYVENTSKDTRLNWTIVAYKLHLWRTTAENVHLQLNYLFLDVKTCDLLVLLDDVRVEVAENWSYSK